MPPDSRPVIKAQLQRILASKTFANAERLRQLLHFLVSESLDDRTAGLKETVIGTIVFKKDASYDNRRDALVRTTASRLRKKLQVYYKAEGRSDPCLIELPPDGYIPQITLRSDPQPEPGAATADVSPVESFSQPIIKGGQLPGPTSTASSGSGGPRIRTLGLLALIVTLVVMTCGGIVAWQHLPKEMQVLDLRQITRDGQQKYYNGPFTDGSLVYFDEIVDGKPVIASVPLSGGNVTYLPNIEGTVLAIAASRKAILVRGEGNELYEVQLGSFAFRRIPSPAGAHHGFVAWDPAGRRVAVSSGDSLTVFELGNPKPFFQSRFPGVTTVSGWDPQGHSLRFDVADKNAVTQWWDLGDRGAVAEHPPRLSKNQREHHGTWTSDGQFFVFEAGMASETQIWVEDVRGNPPRSYQLTTDGRIWHRPTVVPGSHIILAAAGQAQGQLVRLPISAFPQASKPVLAGVPGYQLDYSRDGQWIAYTLFPESTIWRCRIDGSDSRQVSPVGFEAHQPHWSPDGTRIAFMGKRAAKEARWRVYVVPGSGGNVDEPLPLGDDQGVPTWARDGRSLIFGDLNKPEGFEGAAIHELNLQTSKVTTIPAPIGMWSPRMAPDGKYLAAVSYDNKSLYFRDNQRNTWRKCVTMSFVGEPSWPPDSSWVQFDGFPQPNTRGVFRVGPNCEPARKIVDTTADTFAGATWFGIAPDKSPLGFLQMADEIYALDWRLRRHIP